MHGPERIFRRRPGITAAIFILLALSFVSACGTGEDAPQAFVREAPASDPAGTEVLIARGDWSYPPFEFLNEDGEPDGFTVEILRNIAEVMNLDIRIELGPWTQVRSQLEAGEIDILSGMYRTPERDRLLDFTVPHFIASYALFVRDELSIDELEDLPGNRIIVQAGDLAHDFLVSKGFGDDLIVVDDWQALLPAVSAGRADAAIMAMGQGMFERRRQGLGNIRMIARPIIQKPYCIAVPAGRPELLASLNEGLAILKANGSYERIYDRWFGVYENRTGFSDRARQIIHIIAGLLLIVTIAIWIWSVSLRSQVRRKTEQLREELEKQERTQAELRRAVEEAGRERIRAEEADAAKSRFLASVSHELRTPLHGIMGMTELLERTSMDAEQEELAAMIASSAQQLLRVLSDLLEVNRITAGTFSVHRTTFRLEEIAGWLRPLLQQQARLRNLDFTLETQGDGSPLRTDKERIAQVVINLADNAIKYTGRGAVRVHLLQERGTLTIETRDTGPGIPPDQRQRIFEPYFQLNSAAGGKNGLGLGLSVVRSVVDQLGGSIALESGPEGSTFRITVPAQTDDGSAGKELELFPSDGRPETAAPGDAASPAVIRSLEAGPPEAGARKAAVGREAGSDPEDAAPPIDETPMAAAREAAPPPLREAPTPGTAAGGADGESGAADPGAPADSGTLRTAIPAGLRILIAEDEAISRIYLARLLAGLGEQCEQVGDGEAALERLTAGTFDLALIDLSMPRMDGMEVSRLARERGCTTPLIALTAHASALFLERCLEAGMSGFVSKPFAEDELLREIGRVMEMRRDAGSDAAAVRAAIGPGGRGSSPAGAKNSDEL